MKILKMNEVRQAWTSLRSPSKSSTLVANTGSTTTWYDVPTPVIIHCREFQEDVGEKKVEDDVKNKEEKEIEVLPEKSNETNDDEVLYQNNVEAALNSLSKICANSPKVEMDLEDVKNSQETNSTSTKKRHSTTVELKATTSVTTDPEGLPRISFSFLQEDERLEINVLEQKPESENRDSEDLDQLYDFPRNSRLIEDGSTSIEIPNHSFSNENKLDESSPGQESQNSDSEVVETELYDVPKSTKDSSSEKIVETNSSLEESGSAKSPGNFVTIIEVPRKKDRFDDIKRSSRSLKSTRRSCGATESEGDAGIASMSGSYSDPECQNDALSNSSRRNRQLKLQKRRLGKAWSKMRSWLREEKTKIGEVVNRHARMQAVGALTNEQCSEIPRLSKSKSASYDLTKARTQDLGSITRVEEFGLTSVSEEGNISETDGRSSRSPDSGKASTREQREIEEESSGLRRGLLRSKTVSTNDILGNGNKAKLPPVSFSMDKLCSDVENEDTGHSSNDAETMRDLPGKAGPIGKRMLGSIRGLMASTHLLQTHDVEEGGQGGFEDIRRYVKQGGDFCKELAAVLHERAELEATYAKGLSKLSGKLTKACAKDQGGNGSGGVNEAWRCVGEEMEAAAEAHRVWGIALAEQLAKPLRIGVAEAQGRSRKSIENSVDKASKSLQEWRGIAAKSKKQSFACARENERLQDLARLQSISQSQQNNNKSSAHHMTEKEASKLEARRRKAEDSSRRADTEFYTVSVRAERARLEYESTVRKGAKQMELLEEERLSALKDLANVYLAHLQALAPRLQQSADRLAPPIRNCNVSQDVEILKNLIRRMDGNDVTNAEQLLPDFYAEHVTLAMNRERRKQALVRVLHLIRQDLEREKRGREGLETLHRAFVKTPAFAADESTQNVTDKLHHMRSMLLYLEAARYKVGGTLAEVEGSKRGKHPLAEHILVSRDKQGLQQSVLKIPSWVKNESFEFQDGESELELQLTKNHESENRDWADRTAGDGNSENPPDEDDFSDFDEFSSQSEDNNNQDVDVTDVTSKSGAEQCRAIYQYSANLNDELSLNPGDLITVHQKQADGWWIGECRGRTGIFPATYVQVIH